MSAVDCGIKPRLGETKRLELAFVVRKAAELRRINNDWLARNQDTSNVSEWSDMSLRGLLF